MRLETYSIPVAKELEASEKFLSAYLASDVELITQVVQYIIQNGGKRFRPLLLLLSAKLAGYQGREAPKLAAAMEMLHTASLLHDDVVDDAPLRRGKPSTKAKWGNSISILVGDFFWCKMSQIIVANGCLKTLKVVTDTITQTTQAQVLEITKHNDCSIDEETYLKVIRGKTALLLSACCQIGAILGGVPEKYEEALRAFGHDLGVAFQLADDTLDYVSEEKNFGKRIGGDLCEGKLTFPLIAVLRYATPEETKVIKDALLAGQLETAQFQAVMGIIDRYHGIEKTRELAQSFAQKAKNHLEPFKPSLEKEALLGLTDYVIQRSV